jgi:hypothetical protein
MTTDLGTDPQPAIPAAHNWLAQQIIYHGLVRTACRSQFATIWIKRETPRPHPADGPLIVYLNHSAWWDAYMPFLLYFEELQASFQTYVMMEEKQLRPYRFFATCGAFSIDRRRPGESEKAIAYISNRLRNQPNRMLWIFPQGKILPNDQRPLRLYPGIARIIAQTGGALCWPVALRYEFRGMQAPEAFIRTGTPHFMNGQGSETAILTELSERLTTTLDQLRDDTTTSRLSEYTPLMRGRQGIDKAFDRLLALLPPQFRPGPPPSQR